VAGIIRGYALTTGPGVLGTLPLSGAHGLTDALLVAAALNSPLGLVREFDHRSVLALLASGTYQYWAATPIMADIISRCPLTGPVPPAPRVCPVGGARIHEEVFHRFRRRFGVPLRPEYGSTENGTISWHVGAPESIRPRTVGRPFPGVEVVVGSPGDPLPAGSPGRIWVRSPWKMKGYGFPPHLEGGADADATGREAWVPTPDLGQMDGDGYLTLLGRIDDCFKTVGGHLVHPDEIAEALRGHPGVTDAEVVALDRGSGHLIGAVVEGNDSVSAADLHAHVSGSLPAWKRPQAIIVTRALPRLPRGKADRQGCAGLLEAVLRQHP
jgi:acyl-CoA synthetase (AMP-forming)/AMP-acid ligase II